MSNVSISLEVVVLAGFLAATLAFLIHEIYSLDVWWHLRIGRDILESGSIPDRDLYSVLGFDRPYHDSHWLFQVLLASAERSAGLVGVQLTMVVLWLVTLAMTYRATRSWVGPLVGGGLVFLVAMSAVERFLPRPEVITFLMLAAFYVLLQKWEREPLRALAPLIGLQIVWSNSHGLFVLGPFVVACYAMLSPWRGTARRQRELLEWLVCVVVVSVASLVTPFGASGWRYAWQLATQAGTQRPLVFQSLGELESVFSASFRSSPGFWAFLSLLLMVCGCLLLALIRRLQPADWSRLLIGTAMGVLAFSGRRNVVLFTLLAAPLIGEIGSRVVQRPLRLPKAALAALLILLVIWAAYPLTGAFYLDLRIPARFGFGVTPSFFPHGLASQLDRVGFEGAVLNSNTLGGFFLYSSYPPLRPLTDGRWEVYKPEDLEFVLRSSRRSGAWREVVNRFDIRGILLAHTSPEAQAMVPDLSRSPDWSLIYLDAAASFWSSSEAGAGAADLRPLSSEALPHLVRVDDGILLDSFLRLTSRPDLRIENLQRSLALGEDRLFLLELLGPLQVDSGAYEEAEATYLELAEAKPKDSRYWNELAFLAFRKGDLARAQELMRRAVELSPESKEYEENLERIRAVD